MGSYPPGPRRSPGSRDRSRQESRGSQVLHNSIACRRVPVPHDGRRLHEDRDLKGTGLRQEIAAGHPDDRHEAYRRAELCDRPLPRAAGRSTGSGLWRSRGEHGGALRSAGSGRRSRWAEGMRAHQGSCLAEGSPIVPTVSKVLTPPWTDTVVSSRSAGCGAGRRVSSAFRRRRRTYSRCVADESTTCHPDRDISGSCRAGWCSTRARS